MCWYCVPAKLTTLDKLVPNFKYLKNVFPTNSSMQIEKMQPSPALPTKSQTSRKLHSTTWAKWQWSKRWSTVFPSQQHSYLWFFVFFLEPILSHILITCRSDIGNSNSKPCYISPWRYHNQNTHNILIIVFYL